MARKSSMDPVTGARRNSRFKSAQGQSRRARGSITAEFAVVLPAVTVLLALLLLGVSAGMLQLRLEEGARAGARAMARGESMSQAVETASRLTGSNTSIVVDLSGSYATVTVIGRVQGPLSAVLAWQQSARAVSRVENYDSAVGSVRAPDPGETQLRLRHG
ncbi:TadE family type IV pilus minor pilin [Arthrobacter sp. GMC3]|uniref:TadE family type IV pilus minor pilin n=1 Tax=Arthrobacter sp. GMC3 TaxID=2058894 RepID=UPI0015E2948C|nr:TadE family type IV pilus minor pilin [Arthrobacter sp. GMC3]